MRRARAHLVHGEVLGALLGEREAREGAHRARLRRREEQGLALRRARKVRHDGVELAREAEVEQPIGLVEHERAQRSRLEVRGLLEVLQQPPGSGDDERHARDARLLLDEVTLAAGEQRRGERVPRAHLAQDLEDLERELARRRDDERAEPVARGPALAVESLEHRHEERERFARARARGAEHVAPDERVRDARGLDRRRRREASRLEPGLGARRERHLLEQREWRVRLRARRGRFVRAPPLDFHELGVLVDDRRGLLRRALPSLVRLGHRGDDDGGAQFGDTKINTNLEHMQSDGSRRLQVVLLAGVGALIMGRLMHRGALDLSLTFTGSRALRCTARSVPRPRRPGERKDTGVPGPRATPNVAPREWRSRVRTLSHP